MKKRFFLLAFLLLTFPVISKALATNSSYNNIKVYFFYEDNCKSCEEGKNWLEENLKDNKRVRAEYIKINENKGLNKQLKKELNITKNDIPLIILGTNYFIGFNDKTKDNLTKAIKSYEDALDYCDIVSKLQNDEDIKDCIKQNKDIYNQSKSFSIPLIVLIVGGLILIVAIYLVIKKK